MDLVSVQKEDFLEVFVAVKQGIFEYIDNVFGWDDDFQYQRLKDEYELSWFYWVYVDDNKIGLICYKPYDDAVHIHLLLIFPEYRKRMYGNSVMAKVREQSLSEQRKRITLSSFSQNSGAIRFYKRLGYKVVESEEHFVSLSLNLAL
ncbi:GNAT family N-acetyltransferase [Vibrio sp.]|nr:GNAT family N-acetyltransferase [Vibrio sp.]